MEKLLKQRKKGEKVENFEKNCFQVKFFLKWIFFSEISSFYDVLNSFEFLECEILKRNQEA